MTIRPERNPFVVALAGEAVPPAWAAVREALERAGVGAVALVSQSNATSTPVDIAAHTLSLPAPLVEWLPPCDIVLGQHASELESARRNGFRVLPVTWDDPPEQVADAVWTALKAERPPLAAPTLSVCMITKDEEQNLPRALRSVCGLASEIIVIDTGSSDRTVDIARLFGCRVGYTDWTWDFAAARNVSLADATGDWILVLDADEEITPQMRERLPEVLAEVRDSAVITSLLNMHNGQLTQRMDTVRLFRNFRGIRYRGRIHEQVLPSVADVGGRAVWRDLPLLHFGYTPEEDERKDRRDRNLRLLEMGHAEEPDEPLYWHYLGGELAARARHEEAKEWLYRVLRERPDFALAGWSAHLLGSLLVRERELEAAWDVGNAGLHTHYGHLGCITVMGEVALMEGDFLTAERCALRLEELPESVNGDTGRRDSIVLIFRSGAQWEAGRKAEAIETLRQGLLAYPSDGVLASLWVRYRDSLYGYRAATVDSLKEIRTSVVMNAVAGVMARHAQWEALADLAQSFSEWTPYHMHGLMHTGAREVAVEALGGLGLDGKLHLLLWGLELGDEALVNQGLQEAPPHWRMVVEHVLEGRAVPRGYQWVVLEWLRIWARYCGVRAFELLTGALTGAPDQRKARAALTLLEVDRGIDGLRLALEVPGEPGAQEVIGLMAYEKQDWAGAAHFLTARARAGNAPVKVYWRGADALRRTGQQELARQMLMAGREARPISLLLARNDYGL